MNRFEKNVQAGLERQKESIYKECGKAGIEVTDFEEVVLTEDRSAGAISGTLKSIFGGKTKVTVYQRYTMEHDGQRVTLFQPYEGYVCLPGEFHAVLDGAFEAPMLLRKGFFWGRKWKTEESLAAVLKADRQVARAVKALKFIWPIGRARIVHDWALQVVSMGTGQSHVVHQCARYGGFLTYHVAPAIFFDVLSALSASSQCTREPLPTQEYLEGSQFGVQFFEQFV